MKIKLVFDDWRRGEKSVYNTEYEHSLGDFHSGTIFDADIVLGADEEADLKRSLKEGAIPVFYVIP